MKCLALCNGKQLKRGRLVCGKLVEYRPNLLVESLVLKHFVSVQMVVKFL